MLHDDFMNVARPPHTGAHQHYPEYKERLKKLCATGWKDIVLIERDRWGGFSGAIASALEIVETRLLLVYQHDWEILGEVDLAGIVKAFNDPAIRHVRLNKKPNFVGGCDHILEPYDGAPVPLIKTDMWSASPHFALTEDYRKIIAEWKARNIRRIWCPELLMAPKIKEAVKQRGFPDAHREFGTFIYGKMGDQRRLLHLNGHAFKATD
jgi:hypothetical protein